MRRTVTVRVGAPAVRIGETRSADSPTPGGDREHSENAVNYRTLDDLRQILAEIADNRLPPPEGAVPPYRRPATGGKNRPRRLLVEIEPPVLQARTLPDIPPVSGKALRELVALSTGRYFRQNGAPLVSAAAWVAGNNSGTRLARAVAVELPVVESIVDVVKESGNTLVDIIPSREIAPPLSLLPPAERSRRQRRWRRRICLGLIAVGALWVSSLGSAWWWLKLQNKTLASELEELRSPAAALGRARAVMDSAEAMLAALETTRRHRAALHERLTGLVAALPESTVITELAVGADGIRLTGQARSAARVAPALAGIAGPAGIRVSVQGAADTVQGLVWERFSATLPGGRP